MRIVTNREYELLKQSAKSFEAAYQELQETKAINGALILEVMELEFKMGTLASALKSCSLQTWHYLLKNVELRNKLARPKERKVRL